MLNVVPSSNTNSSASILIPVSSLLVFTELPPPELLEPFAEEESGFKVALSSVFLYIKPHS